MALDGLQNFLVHKSEVSSNQAGTDQAMPDIVAPFFQVWVQVFPFNES